MDEKEGNSKLVSNFEVFEDSVVVHVNPKIFSVAVVNDAASRFKEKNWVAVDGDTDDELLVEIKPKSVDNLEDLGREFNNSLLEVSIQGLKVDESNKALVEKLRETISEFVVEEKGRVSKQATVTIGALLAGIGLGSLAADPVSADHMCSSGVGSDSGDADGGVDGGSGGVEGAGGCCFSADQKVLTPLGPKNISDCQVDDEVISYDYKTDSFVTSVIGSVIVHDGINYNFANFKRFPLVKLQLDINGEVTETTSTTNHPFLDPSTGKYKALETFSKGSKIKTVVGEGIVLDMKGVVDKDSSVEAQKEVVYNLHMKEGPHNYIVNGAVVHNKDAEGCCFAEDQSVQTPDGLKHISEFEPGDRVVSFDEEKKQLVTSTVGIVYKHDGLKSNISNFSKNPLINLTIEVDGKEMTTKVTDNHPYLDVMENKYKQVKEFSVGDKVKMLSGIGVIKNKEILIDDSSSSEDQMTTVYNLHMKEGPHNYFVNEAVVHNKEGDGGADGDGK